MSESNTNGNKQNCDCGLEDCRGVKSSTDEELEQRLIEATESLLNGESAESLDDVFS